MANYDLERLKYPIGHFTCPAPITDAHILDWIDHLETLPQRLTDLVLPLSAEQLNTPYRPGGWTVRQLIHHIADSHHHSYTRFKWALTENQSIIKPYEEKDWANLFDARTAPVALSLEYIKALHAKLVYLLRGLSKTDLQKVYLHPEGNIKVTVAENIGKYAWHGNHHFAHIKSLLERDGWG